MCTHQYFLICWGLVHVGLLIHYYESIKHQHACNKVHHWTYFRKVYQMCSRTSVLLKGRSYLHLVRRFWNHVLTWASVIFRVLARAARSALAKYFCRWKRFSSSQICTRENDVRGFFRLGGVRFWYGWPMRRVMGSASRAVKKHTESQGEVDARDSGW